MEAELARDRRRRQLILVLGLVLGIVAAGGVYLMTTRQPTAVVPTPTPPPQREIVIAAQDIPARTVIELEMLTTATLVDDPILERTVSDPSAIIGQVATVDIYEGQVLQPNLYADGNAAGLVILGPNETIAPDTPVWRAVSVSVPRERAVGGFVRAGDRIDLTVTLNLQVFDQTGQPITVPLTAGAATKITYLDLEVLNADPDSGLYVLKVNLSQAEEIAHIQLTSSAAGGGTTAAAGNSFAISLRPSADTRDIDREGYGETTDRIIERYGFPIPRIIIVEVPIASPTPTPAPEPEPEPTPEATPAP